MKPVPTMQDFYDLCVKSKKFHPTMANPMLKDCVDETFHEICYQILDWYDNYSYYPKPEDIIVDYTFCTPQEAHEFLPLFIHFYFITANLRPREKHDGNKSGKKIRMMQIQSQPNRTAVFRTDPENVSYHHKGDEHPRTNRNERRTSDGKQID